MRIEQVRSMAVGGVLALAAFGVLTSSSAAGDRAVFAEKGRSVGAGQVLYDISYDPKDVREMTFVHPSVERPVYEVVIPMGDWTEGAGATVREVRVNGVVCDSFNVFVDGESHVQSTWVTRESSVAKNVVLAARSLWHNDEEVTVTMSIATSSTGTPAATVTRSYTGRAPSQGGGPAGWRRYQCVLLHERDGLERTAEPVEFSLAVRAEDCADLDRELRIFAFDPKALSLEPVAFQTFNEQCFPGTPPDTSSASYLKHPSRSIDVVLLASVPRKQSRIYLACYDNPAAEERPVVAADLAVSGEVPGASVENRFYEVKLDEHNGQIASFALKGREENPAPLLTNSYSRAVHWNPDSFTDNGLWGHTFSWDPPERIVVTARGPLFFRVTMSGRMPGYTPQIWVSVTYSFYASVPYVKTTTSMEVRDPVNVDAIRNGEIVLDSHLITHCVWEEKSGGIRKIRALHGPTLADEWATRIEHDVPWLALTNEDEDYGLGIAVQTSTEYNPNSGEAAVHRPAYYLYTHHFWPIPLTYCTRAWVYPFSDYQRGDGERGPIIPVAVGSTYVEKMAFMPFFLHKGGQRYREIEDASLQVRHPLEQRWGR